VTFVSTDPQSHKGKTDVWLTPLWIVEALGNFDLDPCGESYHKTANSIYTESGLEKEWFGKVWLNPPYAEADVWMRKLKQHNCGTALLFNRFDTVNFQRYAKEATSIFFLEGRIRFLRPDLTVGHNAGTGSVLISYGYTPPYQLLKGWQAK